MSNRNYFNISERIEISKLDGGPEFNFDKKRNQNLLTIQALKISHSRCQGCDLYKDRKCNVFSSGDEKSPFFFVGEVLGKQENSSLNSEHSPFIGVSGIKLNELLLKCGLNRNEVYITNAVKDWPYKNRKPTKEEIVACNKFLMDEIRILQPKIIIALGDIAAQALTRFKSKSILVSSQKNWFINRIPILITYHPSAVLHEPIYEKHFLATVNKAILLLE